ncbi:MAG: glycosyltransferase family 4 protein, partial [Acidobacteriota bacterium]|nr:glycosyltransferase family 4 protein [Acidobacteriota bacterium]
MRILLAHNSLYFPSHGGGDKSNRLLMEALATKGHTVRVIARMEQFGPEAHRDLLASLAGRDVVSRATEQAVVFTRDGVEVHTLTLSPHLRAYFSSQVREFDPDIILSSTDDPAQLLFDIARRAPRARVVYLVRATIAVPFGPDSSLRNEEKTRALGDADGIVGVSEYVADYVRKWSGMPAIHVPISLMEPGATSALGRFTNPFVT